MPGSGPLLPRNEADRWLRQWETLLELCLLLGCQQRLIIHLRACRLVCLVEVLGVLSSFRQKNPGSAGKHRSACMAICVALVFQLDIWLPTYWGMQADCRPFSAREMGGRSAQLVKDILGHSAWVEKSFFSIRLGLTDSVWVFSSCCY